jgi:hypothetical protein
LHGEPAACCCAVLQAAYLRLLAGAEVAVDEAAGAEGRAAAYLGDLQQRVGQLQQAAQRVARLQASLRLPPTQ